jgi:hypothetical protein
MGATDCSFKVKGKDRATLEKNFWKHVKEVRGTIGSRDQGYSGTAAEFSYLTITNLVFNTYEEMMDFIDRKNKNEAFLVQLKVIKDSPTIERWSKEADELSKMIWRSHDDKFRAQTRKTVDKIYTKIKAARLRKAEASKRTEWFACGWVSE